MSTSNRPQVIGLAGTLVGGKDTLADDMQKKFGYTHVSTGDLLRKVAMLERGSIERDVLQEVGNEYRHRLGSGALVLLALETPQPLVVTGLRSLGEAKAIKSAQGVLMYIDAPLEVRYARMLARKRDSEVKLSIEEFAAREQKEWHSGDDDADFNLRDIKKMSDIVFDNTLELEDFLVTAYDLLGIE